MISEKDVEYMAGLARLELNSEEKKKFQKDLGSILDFVEKLKKLDVEGVAPTTAGAEEANVMRTDGTHSKYNQEKIEHMLEQAPDRKDDFVKVKSILNKN
ncbi:MAG: Asp-tRNA(Asn)/Glu-tRNA(Gln) amidotransferase subunit GatC [Candidatus Taylorbacteria bacterium]|nr:Asp-tRNA(Asn)/Glu-tRNA(Gln) amidotransferase subunit GatC [Candidatus Taylorbacteria bacterium]